MRTIYIRNIPDDVAERLEAIAKDRRMSLSALAAETLVAASNRADNARLLAGLSSFRIDTAAIADDIDRARRDR